MTFKCNFYDFPLDSINIITEKFGIRIPSNYLFIDKQNFIFTTSIDQKNIIIGNQLLIYY